MNTSKKYAFLMLLGFGILYAAISLVNHYLFRTYALDLGAYTNALYDYAHFQWNDSRAFKETAENLLADHFDLYLILFSPLSWIFKTYTLLILQIVFILAGGWGVYQYFSLENNQQKTALMAMFWYFSFFGVFSALAYDYHSNVVAASVLVWFFYFLKKKQLKAAAFIFVFILIAKENMSLWMLFVSLGLVWEYRKSIRIRNFLLVLSVIALLYFVLITNWVMPAFSNNGAYPHFRYSVLGENSKEALFYILTHPIESFKLLFINHLHISIADYLKLEYHIYLWISGFFILFRKPAYILMLIPVVFQKMYHDNFILWTPYGQYSIEFLPIMAIGIFSIIGEIKNSKWQKILLSAVIIGNLVVTFRVMDAPILSLDRDRIRFYKESHYCRDFNVKQLHQKLDEIPENAIVSVQSPLMPHLSWRESVYQFPDIDNAQYIILSTHEETYPLSADEFEAEIKQLKSNPKWNLDEDKDGIYIFRKSGDDINK